MSIVVSDLIHSSFRLIGAIAAGEILETVELNDAFTSLNQMISSWNTEGASLVGRQRQLIALSLQNGPYALGIRPVKIEAASVSASGIDSPVDLVDSTGWEAIPEKGMQSVYARKLYCDYAYPSSSVWIWPIPRMGGTLEMWTYIPIAQFNTLGDVVDLPPGYEAGLRYTFAVTLAPEYGRPLDPTVPALAQQFKGSLAQLNVSNQMHSRQDAPMQDAASEVAQQGVTS